MSSTTTFYILKLTTTQLDAGCTALQFLTSYMLYVFISEESASSAMVWLSSEAPRALLSAVYM